MSNTQAKYPHHDLIQAYLNGETIQVRISDDIWSDLAALNTRNNMPSFTVGSVYRKKPTKKEGWVNIYPPEENRVYAGGLVEPLGNSGGVYKTKGDADKMAHPNRIDCVKIEWEQS